MSQYWNLEREASMGTMRADKMFRLNIKTGSKNWRKDRSEAFRFCKENGIVGTGWGLNPKRYPEERNYKPRSIEEYKEIVMKRPDGAPSGFVSMIRAMEQVRRNDIIWTREPETSIYYLCRVIGDWHYEDDEDDEVIGGYRDMDIHNVIPVEFLGGFNIDEVPSKVVRSFYARRTMQIVREELSDDGVTNPALEMSMALYNRETKGTSFYSIKRPTRDDILFLLLPEDVEEIISLYLQVERDYLLYSSTNKIYTAGIECEFISRNGKRRAHIQVKTGGEKLNPNEYVKYVKNDDGEVSEVFLFSTDPGDDNLEAQGVHVLTNGHVIDFMEKHHDILPRRIRGWMERVLE